MARIDYGEAAASAFQASRELPPDALSEWRSAIQTHPGQLGRGASQIPPVPSPPR